jgi:hypothetical protein
MDELLEAAMESSLHKEAGIWKNVLSRLSGWARKVLFREYRTMYEAAKEAQGILDGKIRGLQATNVSLKKMLAHHELPDWREGAGTLLADMGQKESDLLSIYDAGLAKMTARLLKLTPKDKAPKKPIVPALLPEDKQEKEQEQKLPEKAVEEAPKPTEKPSPLGTPEDPIPLTTVKKPAPKTPAPEVIPPPEPPPAAVEPPPPPPPTPTPTAVEPLAGWKKERFGSSGKHGWEWEWEVSPDGNKLRLPTSQLAAASSGKGKILHGRDGRYRPTGGTSSLKLRKLMGSTYWEEEDDPSAPGMSILVRTEDTVPLPLSMRQEPAEQAKKLKDLGKSSAERMECLIALAADLIGEEVTDEEKLEEAAQALLGQFEEEEMDEEEI